MKGEDVVNALYKAMSENPDKKVRELLLKHETFMKEHSDPYGGRTRQIDFLKKEIELIENGNTTTQAIIIQ